MLFRVVVERKNVWVYEIEALDGASAEERAEMRALHEEEHSHETTSLAHLMSESEAP